MKRLRYNGLIDVPGFVFNFVNHSLRVSPSFFSLQVELRSSAMPDEVQIVGVDSLVSEQETFEPNESQTITSDANTIAKEARSRRTLLYVSALGLLLKGSALLS